jgi:drug/metabolite transporter superfamily protein YnfA
LLLMAVTGAWTVSLYLRRQRPAWITIGAGARLGLVAGVLGSWMAAGTTGLGLYALRYWFHSGKVIDDFWNTLVEQQMVQQWSTMGASAPEIAAYKALFLSPEGRGGMMFFVLCFMVVLVLIFSVAGGALGARFLARSRRPEI